MYSNSDFSKSTSSALRTLLKPFRKRKVISKQLNMDAKTVEIQPFTDQKPGT